MYTQTHMHTYPKKKKNIVNPENHTRNSYSLIILLQQIFICKNFHSSHKVVICDVVISLYPYHFSFLYFYLSLTLSRAVSLFSATTLKQQHKYNFSTRFLFHLFSLQPLSQQRKASSILFFFLSSHQQSLLLFKFGAVNFFFEFEIEGKIDDEKGKKKTITTQAKKYTFDFLYMQKILHACANVI